MTVYAPSSSVSVRASHTCTHSHRLARFLIYTDIIDPRHATFPLNNVEGRNRCL